MSTDETVGAMCGKPSVQCRRQGHPHIFVRWRAAIRLVPLSDPPYRGMGPAPMADRREVYSKWRVSCSRISVRRDSGGAGLSPQEVVVANIEISHEEPTVRLHPIKWSAAIWASVIGGLVFA